MLVDNNGNGSSFFYLVLKFQIHYCEENSFEQINTSFTNYFVRSSLQKEIFVADLCRSLIYRNYVEVYKVNCKKQRNETISLFQ